MRLIGFAVMMSLAVVSVGAEAFQGVGSHIRRSTDAPRNLINNDPESAERAANYFARCVAERRGRLARNLLAMEYRAEDQMRRAERLISGREECMDDIGFQLRADGATIIGGMAEYYVRMADAEAELALVSGLTDERIAELNLAPRNGFEHLGLCVARRDPIAVSAFVSTEPRSEEEGEALQQVVPHLGPCVLDGETVRLDRRTVRSVTAVGLYRALAALETAE